MLAIAVDLPQHPRLGPFAEALEQLNWAFFIVAEELPGVL